MRLELFVVAEVMDKEPTLASLWVAAVFCSAIGFALVRFRPWLLIAAVAVAAWLALRILPEIYDPFVGPAIRAEAGLKYVVQAQIASMLPFVVSPLALLFRRRAGLPPN
jgi:hypothetical protein